MGASTSEKQPKLIERATVNPEVSPEGAGKLRREGSSELNQGISSAEEKSI